MSRLWAALYLPDFALEVLTRGEMRSRDLCYHQPGAESGPRPDHSSATGFEVFGKPAPGSAQSGINTRYHSG